MDTAYSQDLLTIFLSLRKRLHLTIARYVRSQSTAEDLVQDTFLRLWERRSHLPQRSMLSGYVVRTGRNLAIDFNRRARIVPFVYDIRLLEFMADTTPSPEENAIAAQTLRDLSGAIAALPPRAREVFVMARIEGMTYVEIAERLGISPKTVFSHMVVALERLEAFQQDEP
ncbi:sigma-70 family RNA polymerase sigma factor [Rhizobium sp. 16-449-1b]|uniref:RNA polymerase sigma factor n=1 Tax=Rhizobium sp. 16-449-1b TaxID=2819989 RepID=UPI001ADB1445|nr:sigma-70 family RNA polymerase sigma factor [Rhizobium sp. 16-449-1b]MBO9195241.1 sigma-70 family RNA polymerase sigma factor [Rhizobium sp. 16-449-1b]